MKYLSICILTICLLVVKNVKKYEYYLHIPVVCTTIQP